MNLDNLFSIFMESIQRYCFPMYGLSLTPAQSEKDFVFITHNLMSCEKLVGLMNSKNTARN